MLSLTAAGLEQLHDLKWKALGLDRDSVLPDELPELIIRNLTEKEIEKLRTAQEEDDADSGILSDNEDDAEIRGPEADEIAFETGEADTSHRRRSQGHAQSQRAAASFARRKPEALRVIASSETPMAHTGAKS